MTAQSAHDVVRCSRIGEDGPCGREQTVVSPDDEIGVRGVSTVSDSAAKWLSSVGWRRVRRMDGGRWLCPFCAADAGLSEGLP